MPPSSDNDIRNPWDEIAGLYTELRLIAAYPEHPYRSRAQRAALPLRQAITSMGGTPVEPDVDPVLGPDRNPKPVSELDARFNRLFGMLAHIDGMRPVCHTVNVAWAELDLADTEAFPLPVRGARANTFPVSGMNARRRP